MNIWVIVLITIFNTVYLLIGLCLAGLLTNWGQPWYKVLWSITVHCVAWPWVVWQWFRASW